MQIGMSFTLKHRILETRFKTQIETRHKTQTEIKCKLIHIYIYG